VKKGYDKFQDISKLTWVVFPQPGLPCTIITELSLIISKIASFFLNIGKLDRSINLFWNVSEFCFFSSNSSFILQLISDKDF